jgi:hypothetical protein
MASIRPRPLSASTVAVVAEDGFLDGSIKHLVDAGLLLENSLRFAAKSRYWARGNAPDFLKHGGDDEMYERLGFLNTATYRKLGAAKYFLTEVSRLFGEIIKVKPPRDAKDRYRALREIADATMRHDTERDATFDAFIPSLVSALDSFACEACLVMGLDNRRLWSMNFGRLQGDLNKARSIPDPDTKMKFLLTLAGTIDKHLDRPGAQADWLPQLMQYRHLAIHRPCHVWCTRYFEVSPKRMAMHCSLILDTTARPQTIIPAPTRPGLPQDEVDHIANEFQEGNVQDYCSWVFDRVVAMLDDAYGVLGEIFEQRANSAYYPNDRDAMLEVPPQLKRTRFSGVK